ncbi:MAG: glycoside hydrolase family 92 protein [Pedobacter sp.]|nr:MAG: glycoside hydrolase family 92 protein [Pedobacter sp.]
MWIKKISLLLLSGITLSQANAQAQNNSYATKVNTRIGMQGKGANANEAYLEAGYTFPGAMLPFGMVQFTPTFFHPNKGFVINQMSGAGCEHMGNLPLLPLAGDITTSPKDMLGFKPEFKVKNAYAGFYEAENKDGINSSLAVTTRTGIGKFDFPASNAKGSFIIGTGLNATTMKEASVKITSNKGFEGFADGGSFCGTAVSYRIYFVAEFDIDALEVGTWDGNQLKKNNKQETKSGTGVYFTFNTKGGKSIKYKVGISYVSLANAKQNLRAENPNWDFEKVKNDAVAAWNKQLSKIEVAGGSADRTTQFYTHFYRTLAHPNVFNDVNGEYVGGDNKVHLAKGFNYYTAFSNWDTYRTTAAMVAVAYSFGAKDFDTKKALQIMKNGAENPEAKSQDQLTRPFLKQYLEKGYMAASMMLEYTTADFAIGTFAKQALGDQSTYQQYLKRAQNWKNIYNPATKWLNSKNEDGSWKKHDEDWREASYKNYFWMIPYNLKGLIDTIGGKEFAEKRLDEFFTRLDASYHQEWFAAGNEPDFLAPWIYNWTNSPYKTQALVKRIIREQYTNRNNGLPGNDDLGAMGAWYVFANIGLYPMIPGVAGFSVNSPSFSSVKIHLKNGTVEIQGGAEKLDYIQSLQLNGKPFNNTWIKWDNLKNGAKLNFKLSSTPNKTWGTTAIPPSYN